MLNVDGEIKNNDTDTADFVKLTATFYDANNRTLGSDVAFTDPTTLEPGQSAPFKMIGGTLGNLDVDEIRYSVASLLIPYHSVLIYKERYWQEMVGQENYPPPILYCYEIEEKNSFIEGYS